MISELTFFLLFFGICFISLLIIYRDSIFQRGETNGNVGFVFIASFVLSILTTLVVTFIDYKKIDKKYETICYIQSIKNASNLNGSFFLGSGNIEEIEYYFYFYKTKEGFVRGKKQVSNTVIVENDSLKPQVQQLYNYYESRSGLFKPSESSVEAYKIVVPKGTVINKFELY